MSEISAEAERYLEIGWFNEPESDRERKIRAVLLKRQLNKLDENPFGASIYLKEQIRYRTPEVNKCAADFRAAWDVVKAACEQRRRADDLRDIEEVIREVDQS